MSFNTEIRKGKSSIDEVLGSHSVNPVDESLPLQAECDELARVLWTYHDAFNIATHLLHFEAIVWEIDSVLTPPQIRAFMKSLSDEDHTVVRQYNSGFISRLIQNSYDAGHNGFVLDTGNMRNIYFCKDLKGTAEFPIRVTIEGDCGIACGYRAAHTEFTIHGKADIHLGFIAKDCTFYFEGFTYKPGKIKPSDSIGGANCTLKTPDRTALEVLKRDVRPRYATKEWTGNKIIFVHPDGQEEVVREYGIYRYDTER